MSPMKEAESKKAKLEDINSETMLEVLRFLYIRKIQNVENLAPNLLYCAHKYELNDLKTHVAQVMVNNLNLDNVLKYYTLADLYEERTLLKTCMYFIKRYVLGLI